MVFAVHPETYSQVKNAGPVITEFGKVWDIDKPEYPTDTTLVFRAVFDIMNSPEAPDQLNPSIETVARYLNMHARSGVPVDQIKAVMVVHNKASKDIMLPEVYRMKYGIDNPNYPLLLELHNAGVEIIFCGQSSLSRDIPKEKVMPEVQFSLSAMTALIQLQNNGYNLIKF
jgi:intracellular sulfur oxidation DsrE/DsrF family protein